MPIVAVRSAATPETTASKKCSDAISPKANARGAEASKATRSATPPPTLANRVQRNVAPIAIVARHPADKMDSFVNK